MKRMIASTISPGETTAAPRLIAPWLIAFTTPAPAPTVTSRNVPKSSEKSRRHSSAASSKSSIAGNSRPSSAPLVTGPGGLCALLSSGRAMASIPAGESSGPEP